MGKGFENYMSKKWFHPTNIDNMKRVYAAKLKESEFIKRQNDLKEQYEREQEVFGNKQLMGDEKARLGLSFLYNAPASLAEQEKKKQNEKQTSDDEDATKLVLASTSKTDKIRNMRCLKCKKWGHANTDKACPLYGKSKLDVDFEVDADENKANSEKLQLAVKAAEHSTAAPSQSDELSLDILVSLSKKEKKALLKRLRKLLKKSKWRKKAGI